MVYCSECGEKNPDGAKFCFKCGAHLIYENEIEDMEKSEETLREVKIKGDEIEPAGPLTVENFKKDMDTLQVCTNDILGLVANFKPKKIDEKDLPGFYEDLQGNINLYLKSLNETLICVSPAVVTVTLSPDEANPGSIQVTTNADEARLNDYVETITSKKNTKNDKKVASWHDKCPVCKNGNLKPATEKKLLGLVTADELKCESCGAVFTKKGTGYTLTRVSNQNSPTWRTYGKQTLTESEWTNIANGGMSISLQKEIDIQKWLEDARKGNINFTEPSSPVILKKNEHAVMVLPSIALWEPRAVRQTMGAYGGPTIRVAKGVSFRFGGVQARSESHEELREIDRGVLTLTTKRLIFAGRKRTTNIDLRKIIALEAYKDGIASQRENKQKTEYFLGTDKISLNITANSNNYSIPINGVVLKSVMEGLIKEL